MHWRQLAIVAARCLVASSALAIAALLLPACSDDESKDRPTTEPHPAVLTRSLSGQPGSLDPQKAEDAFSYDVLRDLYEGLTASAPNGEVVPAAAVSWRVEKDGK